ncbi:MAG: histidine kinase, partial [Bryobacteraceae bacterium]
MVLVSDEPNLPAVASALEALRTEFNKDDPAAISLFTEFLDLNRFEQPDYRTEVLRWLQAKYSGVSMDLIICVSLPALQLMLVHRDKLWSGVPLSFMGLDPDDLKQTALPADVVGEIIQADFEGTANLALSLLPATRHVAVLSGSAQRDLKAGEQMMAIVRRLRPNIDLIDLNGLPFEDLERRLSSLPKASTVLCTTITRDPTGRRFVPRDAIAALAPKTNAPIFGAYGTYMGTGIVGGNLLDHRVGGHDAALLGKRILYEGPGAHLPSVISSASQTRLDWRQLRKWKIPEERIPAASAVLFRHPGEWEEHKTAILLVAGGMAIQSAFLVLLFLERRKLAVIRKELVQLSRNLMRAQEEERSRIARGLHDDLGQRLALFSIELDQTQARLEDPAAKEVLGELSEKAAEVASDVHAIAHGLHPSKLDHLGLLPAVQEFCREVELRSGVDVEVTVKEWPAQLDRNLTLCLYRTVQEALQNVVRHSQAHRATLQFLTLA